MQKSRISYLVMKVKTIEKINFYIALMLVFLIPFPLKIILPFFLIWLVTLFAEGNVLQKLKHNYQKEHTIYLILFSSFAGMHLVSFFISDNFSIAYRNLEPMLSIFIIPFLFFISNKLYLEKVKSLMASFVLGNLFALIVCLIDSFYQSFSLIDNQFFFQSSLFESLNFFESFKIGKNQFSYIYFSEFKHPAYFAMYSIFSLGILTYFFRKKIYNKYLLIALMTFTIIGIYLLSSRAGILTLFIYFIFTIYVYLRSKNFFILKFSLSIVVLSFLLIALFTNSRMEKTLHYKEDAKDKETRLELWQASLKLSQKNLLLGFGLGNTDIKRQEMYNELGMFEAKHYNLNSHNQYLESLLNGGIPLLISLIMLLLIPFIKSIKEKNYLLTLFIVVVSFNFLVESMLERFQGVFFIFFFLSLFVILNPKELKNNKS